MPFDSEFSEFNPLFSSSVFIDSPTLHRIVGVVRKGVHNKDLADVKQFSLPAFMPSGHGVSHHGSDFNNNGSVALSRDDLIRIANEMQDGDSLIICVPDTINHRKFMDGINSVISIGK